MWQNQLLNKLEIVERHWTFFETVSLPAEDEKTQAIIMDFPTVYIHNWQDSGAFEVYVGGDK